MNYTVNYEQIKLWKYSASHLQVRLGHSCLSQEVCKHWVNWATQKSQKQQKYQMKITLQTLGSILSKYYSLSWILSDLQVLLRLKV